MMQNIVRKRRKRNYTWSWLKIPKNESIWVIYIDYFNL